MKRFTKVLATGLIAAMTLSAACFVNADVASDFKVGVILVGDETEGYTKAHMDGINQAAEELGMDAASQIIMKYNVPESSDCYDAAIDKPRR